MPRGRTNKKYTGEFKQKVVETVRKEKLSYKETARRLHKSELLYLQEFDTIKHFRSELEDYLDYYNNRRIKLKLNGLTPAMHRSQAVSNLLVAKVLWLSRTLPDYISRMCGALVLRLPTANLPKFASLY